MTIILISVDFFEPDIVSLIVGKEKERKLAKTKICSKRRERQADRRASRGAKPTSL